MPSTEKVLIYITTSFPYGKREPLISGELPYFYDAFNKIYLFASDTSTPQSVLLDEKVQVNRFSKELSSWEKVRGLPQLFSQSFWTEYWQCKKYINKWPLLREVKVILNSLSLAKNCNSFVQDVIKKEPNSEIFFYSYWCNEPVIGCALLKQKNKNIRLYTRMHAYDLYYERHEPQYLPFRSLIAEQANRIYFISQQGLHYFLNKNKDSINKLNVSKLGVVNDYKVIQNEERETTINLVSCSGIIDLKRVELIIDVVRTIGKTTEVSWVHFGTGPTEQKVVQYAKSQLEDQVNVNYEFKGFLQQTEILLYYHKNNYDLFINLSTTEGIPISIMEAFSFGIPAIATDVGGVKELVNEDNGYLISVSLNKDAIAEIVINHTQLSTSERVKMKNEARNKWKTDYNATSNYKALIEDITNN